MYATQGAPAASIPAPITGKADDAWGSSRSSGDGSRFGRGAEGSSLRTVYICLGALTLLTLTSLALTVSLFATGFTVTNDCSTCTAEQLAAANTGRTRVPVGESPLKGVVDDQLTLSPEAQALVSSLGDGTDVSVAQLLSLPADEQFPVLMHLSSAAAAASGAYSAMVQDALVYAGKDVIVDWTSSGIGADVGAEGEGEGYVDVEVSLVPDALPTDVDIFAGDRLAFYFDQVVDLWEFKDEAAFLACDFASAAAVLHGDRYSGRATAGVVVSVPAAGTYYFASSLGTPSDPTVGGKCRAGFRWAATVGVPTDDAKVLVPPALSSGGGAVSGGDVEGLTGIIQALTRHLVVESTAREQRIRGQGQSGLSRVRGYTGGTSVYNEGTYANSAVANIHNHADHQRTVGMGELQCVLNGVEFWTRHNDYTLRMPSNSSTDYHAVEDIEYPEVPPSVTAAGSVAAQSAEMREYFRAWVEQNETHRDYKPYFKSNLCVLEGAWITDQDSIEEPFASDRHHINARTWRELQDRIRFYINSGRKDNDENLPFLPSSVRAIDENNLPVMANWEYRIFCVPVPDVPLARYRVVEDLHVQLAKNQALSKSELAKTRRARFELHPRLTTQSPPFSPGMSWPGTHGREYIDELMELVPGKDNFPGNMSDDAFGSTATTYEDSTYLNTAYYSRYYQLNAADAMGRNRRRRSFSDPTMWAAMTTQKKVVPLLAVDNDDVAHEQRWTYAMPLEIVYTTPLASWNPYNVPYDSTPGNCDGDDTLAGTEAEPFQCLSRSRTFFQTPESFFAGDSGDSDAADTSSGVIYMQTPNDGVQPMKGSGVWIHLPTIAGVNSDQPIRTRYPIMPVHEMDGASMKEVKALTQLVSESSTTFGSLADGVFGITLLLSGGAHSHTVTVDAEQVALLQEGSSVPLHSDTADGHQHTLVASESNGNFDLVSCDEMDDVCSDGHNALARTLL
jgi:hypothetical protein